RSDCRRPDVLGTAAFAHAGERAPAARLSPPGLLAPDGYPARQELPRRAVGRRSSALESVDLNFWRGRRVLVTGHTGFKGGWLCLWLQQLGAEVHGFALPPATRPSLFELASVGSDMTSMIGDVRDHAALQAALERCRPEV